MYFSSDDTPGFAKRLLTDLDFVDFWDYFGQNNPKNRLKPNPLTVSKAAIHCYNGID